jgi:hypothetical protein
MMIEDGLAPEPQEAEGLPLEDRLGQAALAAVMGDPYEVGLRIALDDGVAAALPAVARELAVLDRAVGVVRSGLAGLAPAAEALPVPVVGASGAEAAPETIRTGANPVPDLPVGRGLAPPAPMETVLRGAERAAGMLPAAAVPEGPVPQASLPPARVAWQRTDWPALAAVPGVAAPVPSAAASFPLEAVAAPPLPELPSAAPEAGAEAPGWAGFQRPSAAPPALPPSLLLPPDFAEPAAPAQAAAPEPEAEQDGERVLEGRLEIDGALLGRFVAEHLAREAGRPPSGMTGFDPLLSPQWAGALQG